MLSGFLGGVRHHRLIMVAVVKDAADSNIGRWARSIQQTL